VTVTSVAYSGAVAAIEAYATLHWIDPDPGAGRFGSILSMRGAPGSDVAEWGKVSGRMQRVTSAGVHLPPTCGSGTDIELLSTLRVSRHGADVPFIAVHYSSSGNDYTLTVPYRYVACGDAIKSRHLCPQQP
jgi:hypothetical protein